MIIDDIGEVIGWKPVAFHDDKMVLGELLSIQSIDNVVDCWRRGAALESDGVCLTLCGSFGSFIGGDRQAFARVDTKSSVHLERRPVVSGHVIVRAEAAECFVFVEQTVGILLIYGQTQRLHVH